MRSYQCVLGQSKRPSSDSKTCWRFYGQHILVLSLIPFAYLLDFILKNEGGTWIAMVAERQKALLFRSNNFPVCNMVQSHYCAVRQAPGDINQAMRVSCTDIV